MCKCVVKLSAENVLCNNHEANLPSSRHVAETKVQMQILHNVHLFLKNLKSENIGN